MSRLRNERVCIGDPANPIGWVKVVDIRGDKVRLGFEFPDKVSVNREEIAAKIVRDREDAAKQGGGR